MGSAIGVGGAAVVASGSKLDPSMRVLVTGGTGFIGRHLCQGLAARGDHVIALVRSPKKAGSLPAGVEQLAGDLSLFANPETVLPECDVVVHLAGVVAAGKLADYGEINFVAVRDLVGCLTRQKWKPARLVFASSLAAAGPSPYDGELTESDPPRPVDPYGEAKARAEEVVRDAPFATTAFRPPIVLGPGDEASLTLFRAARSGVGMRVAGAPQRLSFVDVRDLADAITRMCDDRRTGSYCYYASHPDRIDVESLWRDLGPAVGNGVKVLPVPKPLLYVAMLASSLGASVFRFKNQLDAKQYAQMVEPAWVCSSARLRADLGWAPKHGLADCLANAAEAYREAGVLKPARGRQLAA